MQINNKHSSMKLIFCSFIEIVVSENCQLVPDCSLHPDIHFREPNCLKTYLKNKPINKKNDCHQPCYNSVLVAQQTNEGKLLAKLKLSGGEHVWTRRQVNPFEKYLIVLAGDIRTNQSNYLLSVTCYLQAKC